MTRKNPQSTNGPPRPTDAELGILRALWRDGPATVRQIHESITDRSEGYTTVLKLLQIMHQKGLVSRDESQRAHVYSATIARDETQQQLLGDLLQRAFDGSRAQLVLQALGSHDAATPEELKEIRHLLDKLEGKA